MLNLPGARTDNQVTFELFLLATEAHQCQELWDGHASSAAGAVGDGRPTSPLGMGWAGRAPSHLELGRGAMVG